MSESWRTYYGARGIRASWLILFFCFPLATMWLIGISTGHKTTAFSLLLNVAIFAAVALFVWRHANERVETHPDGVIVVNTWKTLHIRWEDITGLTTRHRYIALQDKQGNLYPPPERWMSMVQRNDSLMLFDMVRGPQELTGIELVLADGSTVKIDALSRRILQAISDGSSQYQQTTSHYPNYNDDTL